jgi:mono/diheme cytochrome c family protein
MGTLRLIACAALALGGAAPASAQADSALAARSAGAGIYQSACLACHGADGKGAGINRVGFDTPLPDFTKCSFATSEPDADWASVIHVGGRARGLSANMPAFGAALSDADIRSVIDYVRRFCTSTAWPRGNLNLPRTLVTEKAFPDNEAFVTTSMPTAGVNRVETRFVYEHRLGARAQYEVAVPLRDVRFPTGWNHGLGDLSIGVKDVLVASARRGTIVAAGAEMTFPTGNETRGLGNRLVVLEPFGSVGQLLPLGAFVHAQAGVSLPLNLSTPNDEVFWRAAAGRSFVPARWGRVWTPMIELLGSRELEFEERARWDLLPELQVTLSRRRHIALGGGIRVPLNLRTRSGSAIVSLLWGYSEGGLFAGW